MTTTQIDERVKLYLAGVQTPLECDMTADTVKTLEDQLNRSNLGMPTVEGVTKGRRVIVRVDQIAAMTVDGHPRTRTLEDFSTPGN
jgi:hypothetical protein